MAQLQQKSVSNKSNNHRSKQKKPALHATSKSLGKAPDDIFNLEKEIASIHINEQNENEIEEEKKDQEIEQNQEEFETYSTSNLSTAKKQLENGEKIKINLSSNITPYALIAICHSLSFDTTKLQKLFSNSSIVVKNILDKYCQSLKSSYPSLSKMHHPYHNTALGYLFHCNQIDALQADENDLSAKCRIKMDLNFNEIVKNDDLFATKFQYEIANKVFHCDTKNVRIMDVREGSVIVVIAGITLITLATVGLLALSVKLHNRRKLKTHQKMVQQKQKQSVGQCIDISQQQQKPLINDVSILSSPSSIQSQSQSKSQSKAASVVSAEKKPSISFFSKIKSGFSDFQKNAAKQFTEQIQQSNNNTVTKGNDDAVYDKLVAMGFNEKLSEKAAKKYSSNINEAINWIMEHENDDEVPDEVNIVDNNEKKEKESKSNFFASLKKSVDVHNIDKEKEIELNNQNININQQQPQKRENLMLNINDLLWVKKKNQLWSAEVTGLTRDKVTIEYVGGKSPYVWRKTETFALNDECLIQKEPGMAPDIEGCIEISKTNGGYIKAWSTGLNRPMADI